MMLSWSKVSACTSGSSLGSHYFCYSERCCAGGFPKQINVVTIKLVNLFSSYEFSTRHTVHLNCNPGLKNTGWLYNNVTVWITSCCVNLQAEPIGHYQWHFPQAQPKFQLLLCRVDNFALWFLKLPHSEAKEQVIYNVNILGGSSSVLETIGYFAAGLSLFSVSPTTHPLWHHKNRCNFVQGK